MRLGEEIAVLDGFEGAIPNRYNAGPQFDVTAGANLTGGSSWNPQMPLTPSQAGLAGADLPPADADLMGASAMLERNKGYHRNIPSSYNAGAVFDPTSGGNYKGGSSWDPQMPLTPSVSDLAAVPDIDLAQVYSKNLRNLKSIPNLYNAGAQFDPTAGQNQSGGSSWNPDMPLTPSQSGLAGTYDGLDLEDVDKYYGSTLGKLPSSYAAGPQFDVTGGQNYSGGSSWDPRLPLTPSNSGLAELSVVEPLDGIMDNVFKSRLYRNQIPAFQKMASRAKLLQAKKKALQALKRGDTHRAGVFGKLVKKIRSARRGIMKPAAMRGRAMPAITQAMRSRAMPVRRALPAAIRAAKTARKVSSYYGF
jgi:hypothetical protein